MSSSSSPFKAPSVLTKNLSFFLSLLLTALFIFTLLLLLPTMIALLLPRYHYPKPVFEWIMKLTLCMSYMNEMRNAFSMYVRRCTRAGLKQITCPSGLAFGNEKLDFDIKH